MKVSIPIGFSSSLQPPRLPCRQVRHASFNPYRVFKFVATLPSARSSCRARSVSIPIGFSSSLQRPGECDRPGSRLPVSIPIGFSSSLQLKARLVVWGDNEPGFNPYRFSSSLQLAKAGGQQIASCKFQSLSGFQVRCNGSSISGARSAEVFQSLSGFQVRCNTIGYPP